MGIDATSSSDGVSGVENAIHLHFTTAMIDLCFCHEASTPFHWVYFSLHIAIIAILRHFLRTFIIIIVAAAIIITIITITNCNESESTQMQKAAVDVAWQVHYLRCITNAETTHP